MAQTFTNILIHTIWSTKKRQPFITPDIKNRLYGYLRTVIEDKGQYLYIGNGMPDHIHMLISISPKICISDFLGLLKANSTKWAKANLPNKTNFGWQDGFACFSVGYSTQKSVIKYIENQETNHQKITFEEELEKLLKMQNITYDPRFIFD